MSACTSCHYTVCSLYKCGLLSLKWDEMGGVFTVCWYCYLNLQLLLGLWGPRKQGSTSEMNHNTHTFSLTRSLTHSLRHTHKHTLTKVRFCGIFWTVMISVNCTIFQNFSNQLLVQSCLTWRSKIWPLDLSYRVGAPAAGNNPFSDRGRTVSPTDTMFSLSAFFAIIFHHLTSL